MPHGTVQNWNIQTLAYAGYVGEYTSLPNDQTAIKIDKDDDACIAYCDWGNYCLKYLTLPNFTGYATKYVQPSAFLTVTPNPVEIGKIVSINITLTPKPPTTTDYYQNITLNVTNPDGTTTTLGPFILNTGTVYTSYIPTQIGNYSMQAKYDAQFFPQIFLSNDCYLLCSRKQLNNFKVQQEPVTTPTILHLHQLQHPLPTKPHKQHTPKATSRQATANQTGNIISNTPKIQTNMAMQQTQTTSRLRFTKTPDHSQSLKPPLLHWLPLGAAWVLFSS